MIVTRRVAARPSITITMALFCFAVFDRSNMLCPLYWAADSDPDAALAQCKAFILERNKMRPWHTTVMRRCDAWMQWSESARPARLAVRLAR